MRRTMCGVVALLALCALPAVAAANGWTLSVQGGASVPSGDFRSETKANAQTGWSIGGAADYSINPSWALGIDGSWGKNTDGAEGQSTDLGGGVTSTLEKSQYSTWQAGAHARYYLPTGNANSVKWYGILGGGLYGFGKDVTTTVSSGGSTSVSSSDKRAGMKLGLGGVWWANPRVGINGGVDYNIAFLDKDNSGFSSLSYAGAYMGLTFGLPHSE
jgi:hypothetical protein